MLEPRVLLAGDIYSLSTVQADATPPYAKRNIGTVFKIDGSTGHVTPVLTGVPLAYNKAAYDGSDAAIAVTPQGELVVATPNSAFDVKNYAPYDSNLIDGIRRYNLATGREDLEVAGVTGDNWASIAVAPVAEPLTLASLSQAVYSPGNAGYVDPSGVTYKPIAPDFISDPDNLGFGAEAFESSVGSQIIIALRGTVTNPNDPATEKDLAADVSFAGSQPSPVLASEVADAASFVSLINTNYPGADITLTGHSLGGALAQLVGEASGLPAVTFNAPGAAQLYSPLTSELQPVIPLRHGGPDATNVNYRIFGDQVSLFGTPIGATITIQQPSDTTFSTIFQSQPLLDAMANLSTFLHLHGIDTVIAQLAANAPVVSPVGEPDDAQALEDWISPLTSRSLIGWFTDGFAFEVTNTAAMLLDPPGGSDFLLTEQAGSPDFGSIDLPTLPGVVSYNLRYQTNGTWSPFQHVSPGFQFSFPANTGGVEFVPLDSGGNGVAVPGSFLIALAFASTGTFTGTLTGVTRSNDIIVDTTGSGVVTLSRDADGTSVDWSLGGTTGKLPIADPNGLTIDDVAGMDTLTLDYGNGDPLPATLHLNGTFTLAGLPTTGDPLAGHAIDVAASTVYLKYASGADPISLVRSYLKNGAAAGTAWASDAIFSSADGGAIAYADAADGTAIDPLAQTIELKYTSLGDSNLDGRVDFADLLDLAQHYGVQTGATWAAGDFNYDGKTDFADLLLLAQNYGHSTPSAPASAEFGASTKPGRATPRKHIGR